MIVPIKGGFLHHGSTLGPTRFRFLGSSPRPLELGFRVLHGFSILPLWDPCTPIEPLYPPLKVPKWDPNLGTTHIAMKGSNKLRRKEVSGQLNANWGDTGAYVVDTKKNLLHGRSIL